MSAFDLLTQSGHLRSALTCTRDKSRFLGAPRDAHTANGCDGIAVKVAIAPGEDSNPLRGASRSIAPLPSTEPWGMASSNAINGAQKMPANSRRVTVRVVQSAAHLNP